MPGANFKVDRSEWKHDPDHDPANGGSDWYEHVLGDGGLRSRPRGAAYVTVPGPPRGAPRSGDVMAHP
ncbi:hypothetical protein FB570_102655 [Streptomyces sp. T12]|nr:hypothetical protein FB570_102655 [Streptomyces sp. T12]